MSKMKLTIDIEGRDMLISDQDEIGYHRYFPEDANAYDQAMAIAENVVNYLLYDRAELEVNDYDDFERIHEKDLVEKDSLVGEHIISGCEYTNDSFGFCAMIFILDGQTYLAMADPDDGYRSYLGGFFKTERQCPKNLPDIRIEIQHQIKREIISAYERRDYKGYGFVIKDPRFKEDILMELGTDYSEDYYPTCVMHYMPENIKEVQ